MSVLTYNSYDSSSTAIVCTSYTLRTVQDDQQIPSGVTYVYRIFRIKSETRKHFRKKQKPTPWPESSSELYRSSDRRLLAKLVPTLRIEGCRLVSVVGPLLP
jgi:hypothetical protein